MAERVTDPELLKLLNAPEAPAAPQKVTDPPLLQQLSGPAPQPAAPPAPAVPVAETEAQTQALEQQMGMVPRQPVSMPMGDMAGAFLPTSLDQTKQFASQAYEGRGLVNSAVRAAANGATNGGADKLASYLNTGFGLTGDVGQELANQRAQTDAFAAQHPWVSTGAGMVGAGARDIGIAGAGLLPLFGGPVRTATGAAIPLLQRSLKGAASMGALNGLLDAAANDGSATDKVRAGAQGYAVNSAIGGVAPLAGALLSGGLNWAKRTFLDRARPENYAANTALRTLDRSGQTADQVGQSLRQATAEGQDMFTAADALGAEGQRALTKVTKAPGPGRVQAKEFLEGRAEAQPDRLTDYTDQAFGTNGTARQSSDALIDQARAASRPLYDQAQAQGISELSPRLKELMSEPIIQRGLREGAQIERMTALAEGRPADVTQRAAIATNEAGEPTFGEVPNMRALQAAKIGLDNILEGYRDKTTGRLALDYQGQAIDKLRRAYLEELVRLNPTYGKANAAFRGPMEVKDAITQGKQAAGRGRSIDNIQAFQGLLNAPEQQGFRTGYADRLLGNVERRSNDATPLFTTPKAKAEIGAFALPEEAPKFQRRVAREKTMAETKRQALGGSQTAENLADAAEGSGVDVDKIAKAIRSPLGALADHASQLGRLLNGNTEAGREALGRLLLSNDPQLLKGLLDQAIQRSTAVTNAADSTSRSAFGLTAAATDMKPKREKKKR
jgi:hypothetical protein